MITALLYLQLLTVRNRIVARVKRLKRPKYLVGGIVGLLYFYFYFFRYLLGTPRGGRGAMPGLPPEIHGLIEMGGALVLAVLVLFAWFFPHQRSALVFSEAEIAFLFPAPISRRGLIHFKLLRSQMAIFFTVLLLTLVTQRFGGRAWIHGLGWWLILSTLNLHFLGCSFVRTMLLDRGVTPWRRRLVILTLLALIAGWIGWWLWRSLPRLPADQVQSLRDIGDYARLLLSSGPLPYLLYPFRLVLRPYLATDASSFLVALGPALALLLAHYAWVVWSDVSFEESSLEASRKAAENIAAVRSGRWQSAPRQYKTRRAPFVLRPAGPKPVAFLWKNLISVGQGLHPRFLVMLAVMLVIVSGALGQNVRDSGVPAIVLTICAVLLAWSIMLGPLIMRQDFRQDLELVDILKLYPVRGWQVVLGELLTPACILTAVQWLLLSIGVIMATLLPKVGMSPLELVMLAVAAGLLLPLLDLVILLIPNAGVLLLPAWFQPGKEGAHGIEATGQRLIMMIAQLLAFIIALVPAAALFVGLFFLLRIALGNVLLAAPVATIAAGAVLAAEIALAIMLLGSWFERYDLSAET